LLKKNPMVIDMVGKFSLNKFIEFLSSIDIFVAASTGPLHISASLGKATIGLFPPVRPMFPLKWGPIGLRSSSLVVGNNNCEKCRKTKRFENCIKLISPPRSPRLRVRILISLVCKIKRESHAEPRRRGGEIKPFPICESVSM
jgi:ADP-heptose:LPS heptosyltransferase